MVSPSRSMLSFVLAGISCLLACGRSTSSPGAGGNIAGTVGTGGATSPVAGTSTGGVAEAGGAWATGGTMPVGGTSRTGGQPGTGGLGRGGTSAASLDAAEISATGGAIAGTGGATTATAGTGGTLAFGGALGLGGAAIDGGLTVTGGTGGVVPPPKFFGNLDTRNAIRSDFATYWDQFTPENAGKWGSVQPSGGAFNWGSLDAMYKYCEDNHIVFKEQNFIWGSAQPSWINNSNAAELARTWMKIFCDRYPKTRIIDVVYEPIHMKPAFRDGLGGAGTSGWDWVVNSFIWAREACPNAVLVVNDYNILEIATDHTKFIDLVKASLAAGAPITAIGAESHDLIKVSLSTVQKYLAELVDQTGLPVYITEMDLGIADDAQQATMMKDLVTTFWNNSNVLGITYWGYVAGATWRSNTELLTSTGTMRPAMVWLMDFLHR
jgi:endo-1,4-beta-xylanase